MTGKVGQPGAARTGPVAATGRCALSELGGGLAPVGLLTGKQAYVFAARGGRYAGTPSETQTPFLRTFLGFVGISEVEFVYAEGLATGDAGRQTGLARARSALRRLFDGAALAA